MYTQQREKERNYKRAFCMRCEIKKRESMASIFHLDFDGEKERKKGKKE